MSRKKIYTAGFLCGFLLAGMTHTDLAYAASPSLSASADTGSVAEGDYVNVDVDLGNNPSISTLGATLNYDSSVLKYDSSTWNGGFSGSDMQMASDTGSEVNLSVVCDDNYAQDGTVVTVRFQAVKDSDSIPVTLALRDMADADLSAVSDCQVTSAVYAPQPAASKETGSSQEHKADAKKDDSQDRGKDPDSDMVDLENPDATAGISIIDEESGAEEPVIVAAVDTGSGAGSDTNVTAGMTQGETAAPSQAETKTQTVAAQAAASRPDRNYRTGAGIGIDVYLIGAAVCGLLALMLSVRHYKKK